MTKLVVPSKEFFLWLIQILIAKVSDSFTEVGCCSSHCRLSEAGRSRQVISLVNVNIDGISLFGDGP